MAIGFDIGGVYGVTVPDRNLQHSSKPRVLKMSFGDGYEQRLKDGINSIVKTFSLSFNNREKAEIDDIMTFFDLKGGVTSFDFTYPDSNSGGSEKTIRVVCEEYTQTYNNDEFYGCTASFRQVYEP